MSWVLRKTQNFQLGPYTSKELFLQSVQLEMNPIFPTVHLRVTDCYFLIHLNICLFCFHLHIYNIIFSSFADMNEISSM